MQTCELIGSDGVGAQRNHPTIHLTYKANSKGFRIVGFTSEEVRAAEPEMNIRLGMSYYRKQTYAQTSSLLCGQSHLSNRSHLEPDASAGADEALILKSENHHFP